MVLNSSALNIAVLNGAAGELKQLEASVTCTVITVAALGVTAKLSATVQGAATVTAQAHLTKNVSAQAEITITLIATALEVDKLLSGSCLVTSTTSGYVLKRDLLASSILSTISTSGSVHKQSNIITDSLFVNSYGTAYLHKIDVLTVGVTVTDPLNSSCLNTGCLGGSSTTPTALTQVSGSLYIFKPFAGSGNVNITVRAPLKLTVWIEGVPIEGISSTNATLFLTKSTSGVAVVIVEITKAKLYKIWRFEDPILDVDYQYINLEAEIGNIMLSYEVDYNNIEIEQELITYRRAV